MIGTKNVIEMILVLNSSGIPVYSQIINRSSLIKDKDMLGGFLSAIGSFQEEIFQKQIDEYCMDSGSNKINIFKGSNLLLVIIARNTLVQFRDQFQDLLSFFAKTYDIDSGLIKPQNHYEQFRRKLIRVLYHLPICEDWIPIIKEKKKADLIQDYPELAILDNRSTIFDYVSQKNVDEDVFLENLNSAFFDSYLIFDNIYDDKDILRVSDSFRQIFNEYGNEEYKTIKSLFPDIKIVKFTEDVEKGYRIFELKAKYGEFTSKLLAYFVEKGYFELLDDLERNVMIMCLIVEDFIRILKEIVQLKELKNIINKIIENIDDPILYQLFDTNNDMSFLKIQNIRFFFITDKQKRIIINSLMKLIENTIEFVYSKHKTRFNEAFYKILSENYLQNIHRKDLVLIEQILKKLEQLY
jgi:hypothetical protein